MPTNSRDVNVLSAIVKQSTIVPSALSPQPYRYPYPPPTKFTISTASPSRTIVVANVSRFKHDEVVLDRDATGIDLKLRQQVGHGQGTGDLMRVAVQRNLQFTVHFSPFRIKMQGWLSTARRRGVVSAQPRALARALRPARRRRVLQPADRAAPSDRVLRRAPARVQLQHAGEERRSSRPGIDARLETLFARGIDPHEAAGGSNGAGAAGGRVGQVRRRVAGARRGACVRATKPIAR